jgi:hypothetical protein
MDPVCKCDMKQRFENDIEYEFPGLLYYRMVGNWQRALLLVVDHLTPGSGMAHARRPIRLLPMNKTDYYSTGMDIMSASPLLCHHIITSSHHHQNNYAITCLSQW